MKLNKLSSLLFIGLLSSSLLFSACKKEEATPIQVPPEEKIDPNSFSMEVNSVNWVASGNNTFNFPILPIPLPSAGAIEAPGGLLVLSGAQIKNNDTTILVIVQKKKPEIIGEYTLNFAPLLLIQGDTNIAFYGKVQDIAQFQTNPFLALSASAQGTLKITKYDATNRTISGQFNFNQSGVRNATITNGLFNAIRIQN